MCDSMYNCISSFERLTRLKLLIRPSELFERAWRLRDEQYCALHNKIGLTTRRLAPLAASSSARYYRMKPPVVLP